MQHTVSCNFAFFPIVASYKKKYVTTFVSYYMQFCHEAPTTSSTQDFADEGAIAKIEMTHKEETNAIYSVLQFCILSCCGFIRKIMYRNYFCFILHAAIQ